MNDQTPTLSLRAETDSPYSVPPSAPPPVCNDCQRGPKYYTGCSQVCCPQRRFITAQPRDIVPRDWDL